MPDTQNVGGTELRLNGIGLRTYSILHIHVYVAALYLEAPSHDAAAILASPGKKLLIIRFVHDVDADAARKVWQEGFESNCRSPCRLDPIQVARYLAAVPAVHEGDTGMWIFTPGSLQITLNGKLLGVITDAAFSREILATFIGPEPPTARLKRELLGLRE